MKEALGILGVIGFVIALIAGALWGWPRYRVYKAEMSGKAILREAEFTRQVAELDAKAEVERAKGVAESNEIIAKGLEGNEAYLRYLWIQSLNGNEIIYVPTEANLPILEATRSTR